MIFALMGESVLVHALARQCRRSWKKSPTCDFSLESLSLRCDHQRFLGLHKSSHLSFAAALLLGHPLARADGWQPSPGVYPKAHEDEDHATRDETDLSLRPDIAVRADSPPTFLLQAEDDQVDGVEQSLAYYVALQKAGVPTEMHLYAQGGHAFGLRPAAEQVADRAMAAIGGNMVGDHWNGGRGPRTLTDGMGFRH
jgi:acetyl esterase/lipase